ncbi:MAG: sensor histidine kinase [Clostridia bacterium]
MHKRLKKWFTGGISIRKKLVLCFGILVSIAILVLGGYTYWLSVMNFEEQTNLTMKNNIEILNREMEYRFQREMDYLKYIAYSMNLRRVLEYQPNNRVAIAKVLNDTVEPMLWYYIASDGFIKGFDIYTPYIDYALGAFLKNADACDHQAWYAQHSTNFRNIWTYHNGDLSVSRTLLDTTSSSQPLGVIRINFFLGSFIEPFEAMDYLSNGLLVTTAAGEVIYHKKCGNQPLDDGILNGEKSLPAHLRVNSVMPTADWKMTYYIDQKQITGQLHNILKSTLLMVFGCLATAFLVVGLLSKTLTRRIERLKKHVEIIATGRLDVDIFTEDTDEIGMLTNAFGHMTAQLRDTIQQVYVIQLEKRAAELKALQAMINPHFLYNVLSTIKWRAIRKGDEDISNITGLLAKFYRTSLNEGQQLTTVGCELQNVRAYVELQQQLLDESFAAEYTVDESLFEYSMLNFLLQPIVENAIKHGIVYCEEGKGKISVTAHQEDDFLVFTVRNNGPLMNMDTLDELMNRPGKGYGIYNIKQRIDMYYGNDCGVFVRVEGELVCFEVRITKQVKG